jgi:hypothetical protein
VNLGLDPDLDPDFDETRAGPGRFFRKVLQESSSEKLFRKKWKC